MKPIYVTEPALPDFDEYVKEIKSIWETKHITNFGPKYQRLREIMKERYGYQHVDFQCNGHLMLQNILSCIEPGEIITTPFTFVSTTLAILNSGHTPVFCDIECDTYNIDVSKIEDLITDKTVAIVPVHVFGTPCDVDTIGKIAEKHNLKVVYDAAHAFNVKVDEKEIGSFGDASMFSMHATKVFNTIEGGMGVFNDEGMMTQAVSRSNFGISDGLTIYNGVNSKMNEFSAAMGIVNLKHLDDNILQRERLVKRYNENLSNVWQIKLLKQPEKVKSNYAYYPIVIQEDVSASIEDLKAFLETKGFFPRRYFYPSINKMPVFSRCKGETRCAESISDRVLCLPLAASMTTAQIDAISEVVKDYFENK